MRAKVGIERASPYVNRAARSGCAVSVSALRASMPRALGIGSHVHGGAGSSGRPSGEVSSTAPRMSLPETPSIAAWWTLV